MNLFNLPEVSNSNMRALSWKEPYASLMLHGKVETRTWKTDYRGLVLICASKKSYSENEVENISGLNQCKRILDVLDANELMWETSLRRGKAIAVGRLVGCRRFEGSYDEDPTFVKYNHGLWLHFYEDVRPIVPFDYKGSQGWGKVSQDIFNKIEYCS